MSMSALIRRFAVTTVSALAASGALVAFFAWIALSVEWEIPEPEALTGPSEIRARDGTLLARFDAEIDRRVVHLDAVSQEAVLAVITAEDARFYEHEGVDTFALLRAVASNVRTGAITQGGSTLTQQYVKNAFTGDERTMMRKVREAVISIQLERELDKDEILEQYLNTVYFGEGAYGIQAAALTYFGVSASDLDLAQAATLAQLLPAPSVRNPRVDPTGAESRRDMLINRMATLGTVTRSEADAAIETPLEVRAREPWRMREPYFTAHVRRVVEQAYGSEALVNGSLTIRTTLDLEAQDRMREAMDEHLPETATGFEAGVAAVVPATGDLVALHGGRDFYGDTSDYSATNYAQVNLATQGRRQAGSTFKPFVLIAALEEGMSPQTRYPGPGQITIGDWSPRNVDSRNYSSISLAEAMAHSVNTVYAALGADVTPEAILDVAARLGVASEIERDITVSLGAMARGPTVLDMASAFATLANDGLACPARTVLEVRDKDGNVLEPPPERQPDPELLAQRPDELKELDDGHCYQAVDPDIARLMNGILVDVVERGTGRRAQLDRPVAGKTGTTNEVTDAWFVGYTPDFAAAVWIGDPDERRSVENVGGFSQVYGGTLPAVIWQAVAERLLEDVPPRDFLEPGALAGGGRRPGPAILREDPSPEPTVEPDDTDDDDPEPDPDPSPTPTDDDDEDGGGPCIPPIITSGC
jgi:penicillin-binding protein 1A